MRDGRSDNSSRSAPIQLALDLAASVQAESSRDTFLSQTMPGLLSTLGSDMGGIVCQRDGKWYCECWVGPKAPLPENLIGEAIDQSAVRRYEQWFIQPMPAIHGETAGHQPAASALVLKLPQAEADSACHQDLVQTVVMLLAGALQRVDIYQRQGRRIEQLTAILSAAVQWQRVDDDEALLMKIADTATDLLHCERASIFLWDKRRKKLIGRPALGIEGNSLEVDDNAGVVGEVLATGEPKIWNQTSDDESRINRKVDRKLEFETRSLVAVPMISNRVSNRQTGQPPGSSGATTPRANRSTIGVFEAINSLGQAFNDEDAVVLADLAHHASVAIESLQARKQVTQDRDRLVQDAASSSPLIGEHPSVENVRQNAKRVASTDLGVLILGQNGTGKEVLAKMVHYESDRRSGPFVAINCAAMVETLLESELFGHEKGAFTDANQTRAGKFELASGGTLFLDEVGDMSPSGQAKLLRVLEEKVVVRVGGSTTIPVDVRVIAATNQPLEQLIEQKRFREDLFFRLNVVSLTLPPLSQRGSDILLLANHFLEHFCYQIGRAVPTLSKSAAQTMQSYAWPGNIRELRNTMERVCYLVTGDSIEADDLMLRGNQKATALPAPHTGTSNPLADATKEFQIGHIEAAIEHCGGNMTDAAARLGLHRSNLYRKMRQLGMQTSGEV